LFPNFRFVYLFHVFSESPFKRALGNISGLNPNMIWLHLVVIADMANKDQDSIEFGRQAQYCFILKS